VETERVQSFFLVIVTTHVQVIRANEGSRAKKGKNRLGPVLIKIHLHNVSHTHPHHIQVIMKVVQHVLKVRAFATHMACTGHLDVT
jgi:hypothetical protein